MLHTYQLPWPISSTGYESGYAMVMYWLVSDGVRLPSPNKSYPPSAKRIPVKAKSHQPPCLSASSHVLRTALKRLDEGPCCQILKDESTPGCLIGHGWSRLADVRSEGHTGACCYRRGWRGEIGFSATAMPSVLQSWRGERKQSRAIGMECFAVPVLRLTTLCFAMWLDATRRSSGTLLDRKALPSHEPTYLNIYFATSFWIFPILSYSIFVSFSNCSSASKITTEVQVDVDVVVTVSMEVGNWYQDNILDSTWAPSPVAISELLCGSDNVVSRRRRCEQWSWYEQWPRYKQYPRCPL